MDIAAAWDTPALAALVNLSPSRFRHLFKQETGTSPAQYLKDYRMFACDTRTSCTEK